MGWLNLFKRVEQGAEVVIPIFYPPASGIFTIIHQAVAAAEAANPLPDQGGVKLGDAKARFLADLGLFAKVAQKSGKTLVVDNAKLDAAFAAVVASLNSQQALEDAITLQ